MYTSDTRAFLQTGLRYLAVSIAIAAAAMIYGLFSHGVYSYYMTYAFMIPLICGALPHLTAALKREGAHGDEKPSAAARMLDAKYMQLAAIVTLTTGSLLKGALDIYGTTNRLLIVYPVAAAVIIAGLAVSVIATKSK